MVVELLTYLELTSVSLSEPSNMVIKASNVVPSVASPTRMNLDCTRGNIDDIDSSFGV